MNWLFFPHSAYVMVPSVLRNRNDLLRFRLWKSCGSGFGSGSSSDSGSGSGSRQCLAQFSKNEKVAQNLAFSMSEAAYFPESWPLISFLLFNTF